MSIFSSTKVPSYDLDCLIYNVYFESRGEPKKGKLAVALVTLNRADNGDSICKTVYAPKQFSWTAKAQKAAINVKEWKASKEAAIEAYMNRDILGKFTATHYHNDTVSPKWGLRKVAVIGKHTFYKA
jgi:spore germination cell wall hydrolase CwlJ-like protein